MSPLPPPCCCWSTHCIIHQDFHNEKRSSISVLLVSVLGLTIYNVCENVLRACSIAPDHNHLPASPLSPVLHPSYCYQNTSMKSCGSGHNFNLYNTEYSDCSKLHICKYSSEHGRNQHSQHTRLETMTTPESASKECLFIIHNGAAKHSVLGITSLSIQ